jgi:hypothetical protein
LVVCPALPGFFYSQPSMALSGQWTEPLALIRALPNCWQCLIRIRPAGHRRFAPMYKIAPGDFVTFVLAAYAPWDSIACRLAATAVTLVKCPEIYAKLSVCWQQS